MTASTAVGFILVGFLCGYAFAVAQRAWRDKRAAAAYAKATRKAAWARIPRVVRNFVVAAFLLFVAFRVTVGGFDRDTVPAGPVPSAPATRTR